MDHESFCECRKSRLKKKCLSFQIMRTFKARFQNGEHLTEFWLQGNISDQYPGLRTVAKKSLIVFPFSYLFDRRFIVVTDLVTRKRNRFRIMQRRELLFSRFKTLNRTLKSQLGTMKNNHTTSIDIYFIVATFLV